MTTSVTIIENDINVTVDEDVTATIIEDVATIVVDDDIATITVTENDTTVTVVDEVDITVDEDITTLSISDGVTDHNQLNNLTSGNPHTQYALTTDLTAESNARIAADVAFSIALAAKENVLGNPSANGYILSSTTGGIRSWIVPSAGVSDHGALTGLGDDDHTQYYDQVRGDIRYGQLAAANIWTLGPNIFKSGADGNVAVAARRHSAGAAADIFQVQDQVGTALANVSASGLLTIQTPLNNTEPNALLYRLGIGTYVEQLAIDEWFYWSDVPLSVGERYTDASGDYHYDYGISAILSADLQSGDDENAEVIAMSFSVDLASTATIKPYSIAGAYGFVTNSSAVKPPFARGGYFAVANYDTGGITRVEALSAIADNYGAGTVDEMALVYVPATLGVGPVTTRWGLFIGAQTGATNNYAILTDGGEVRHKAGSATVIPMVLQLAAAQTANAFDVRNSSDVSLFEIESSGCFDFRWAMGDSTKDPATQAPADWVEIKINGTTRYLPAYAA